MKMKSLESEITIQNPDISESMFEQDQKNNDSSFEE